jgi:hypothetical protein
MMHRGFSAHYVGGGKFSLAVLRENLTLQRPSISEPVETPIHLATQQFLTEAHDNLFRLSTVMCECFSLFFLFMIEKNSISTGVLQ